MFIEDKLSWLKTHESDNQGIHINIAYNTKINRLKAMIETEKLESVNNQKYIISFFAANYLR